MNKNRTKCCEPKRRPKRNSGNKKIGLIMLLLGTVTVLFLILPLKCWVLLLSLVLIICGILLIKK